MSRCLTDEVSLSSPPLVFVPGGSFILHLNTAIGNVQNQVGGHYMELQKSSCSMAGSTVSVKDK